MLRLIDSLAPILRQRVSRARGRRAYRVLFDLAVLERRQAIRRKSGIR